MYPRYGRIANKPFLDRPLTTLGASLVPGTYPMICCWTALPGFGAMVPGLCPGYCPGLIPITTTLPGLPGFLDSVEIIPDFPSRA